MNTKDPLPIQPGYWEQEIVRKDTPLEALYMGRFFSVQRKWYWTSPDDYIMQFLRKSVQIRCSNPYNAAGSSECKGHISRGTLKGVKNLGQEGCFFPEFWYPPEEQTPAWQWNLAMDPGLNQNFLSLSLLFHSSLSLKSRCCKFNKAYTG